MSRSLEVPRSRSQMILKFNSEHLLIQILFITLRNNLYGFDITLNSLTPSIGPYSYDFTSGQQILVGIQPHIGEDSLCIIRQFPYTEDFETAPAGWEAVTTSWVHWSTARRAAVTRWKSTLPICKAAFTLSAISLPMGCRYGAW